MVEILPRLNRVKVKKAYPNLDLSIKNIYCKQLNLGLNWSLIMPTRQVALFLDGIQWFIQRVETNHFLV